MTKKKKLSFLQNDQISDEKREQAEIIQREQSELEATQEIERIKEIMSHPAMGETRIKQEDEKRLDK
jgi:hypothetical protein